MTQTSFYVQRNHFDYFNTTIGGAGFQAILPWSNKQRTKPKFSLLLTGVRCDVPTLWPIAGLLKGARVSWQAVRTGKYQGCWCVLNALPVGNGKTGCKRKEYAVMETCCCVPLHLFSRQGCVGCPQVWCANTLRYWLPHAMLRLHLMLS